MFDKFMNAKCSIIALAIPMAFLPLSSVAVAQNNDPCVARSVARCQMLWASLGYPSLSDCARDLIDGCPSQPIPPGDDEAFCAVLRSYGIQCLP